MLESKPKQQNFTVNAWCPTSCTRTRTDDESAEQRKHDCFIFRSCAKTRHISKAKGSRRVSAIVQMSAKYRYPQPKSLWRFLVDALASSYLLTDNIEGLGWERGNLILRRGTHTLTRVWLTDLDDDIRPLCGLSPLYPDCPDDAIPLYGRLSLTHTAERGPVLTISGECPLCGKTHEHDADFLCCDSEPFNPKSHVFQSKKCTQPTVGSGYMLQLDPLYADDARLYCAEYLDSLKTYNQCQQNQGACQL